MALKKELKRFLVAGISAVATDLSTYYFLLQWFDEAYSKAVSFILGSVVAYLINKYWTFENSSHPNQDVLKFVLLYIVTLFANVSVNQLSLTILPEMLLIAFLAATATSTVLNFLGMKFWVFRKELV